MSWSEYLIVILVGWNINFFYWDYQWKKGIDKWIRELDKLRIEKCQMK